jgi:hypothetical protein
MGRRGRKAGSYSNFGKAVTHVLDERGVSQSQVVTQLANQGNAVSSSYMSQTMTGRKPVSPTWADLVADVLNLPNQERQKLHEAAAIDRGYKLDLTKKGR